MNTIVIKQNVTRNMFGPQVADGWTPLLAVVEDGERRVFQITDWIGGTGDKPPVGMYLGEHGLVNTPAEATDIGVPTDYSSRDALAGARVPTPVQYVRTAGYHEAGDGGGALYKRVAFEPDHGGKVQSADGAWWELAETTPNVRMFGARGTTDENDIVDDYDALQEALNFSKGRELRIPPGRFFSSKTLIAKKGTRIVGVGPDDPWYTPRLGSIIEFYGEGNGKRWTDIDGGVTDKNDFRPGIVLTANCSIEHITVQHIVGGMATQDSDLWDAAIYIPAQQRVRVYRCNTIGKWQNGIYGDATWGLNNTTLTSLHPDVEVSSSLIELVVEGCWLRGRWGASIVGTTRDPDAPENLPWVWSTAGTSDHRWIDNRIEGGDRWYISEALRIADGGCYRHDAATASSAARTGQGHTFLGCSFRSGAKYLILLDRSNNDKFIGSYGELNISGFPFEPPFAITSRTGMVSLVSDSIKNPLSVDGIEVASSMNNLTSAALAGTQFSRIGANGHIATYNVSAAGWDTPRTLEFTSSHASGATEFYAHPRDLPRELLYRMSSSSFRPGEAAAEPDLGVSTQRFGTAWVKEINVQTTGGNCRILTGSTSPEGTVTAVKGSLYLCTGSGIPALWIKGGGTGNTGWQPATLE